MFDAEVTQMILIGIKDTLYMTLFSVFFGYVLGLPFGIVLNVTRKDGLKPNRIIHPGGGVQSNKITFENGNICIVLHIIFMVVHTFPHGEKQR